MVDPRRTVTVDAERGRGGRGQRAAPADQLRHRSRVLFNALLTEIAERGWVDQRVHRGVHDRLRATAVGGEPHLRRGGSRHHRPVARQASAPPRHGSPSPRTGHRRRTMLAYEKGLIWGNDNYRTNQALVNLGLATGNIGRPRRRLRAPGWASGRLRAPVRTPTSDGPRPTSISYSSSRCSGGVHHVWGCDAFKTTLDAAEYKRIYKRRTDLSEARLWTAVPAGDRPAHDGRHYGRDPPGRAVQRRMWTSCRPRSAAAPMSCCPPRRRAR